MNALLQIETLTIKWNIIYLYLPVPILNFFLVLI